MLRRMLTLAANPHAKADLRREAAAFVKALCESPVGTSRWA
jgi:hypothetical protein